MAHAVGHPEQCCDTVGKAGNGAYSDQRIHIGGFVPQRFDAPAVVYPVQINGWQREKQLEQSGNQRVFRPVIPVGNRKADHVAHGKIHQNDQTGKRTDNTDLHFPHGGISRNLLNSFLLDVSSNGCAVSGFLYGDDDVFSNSL